MINQRKANDNMKIVVVGLGSMGTRRISLLLQYNPTFSIVGIDPNEKRREKAAQSFGIKTEKLFAEALRSEAVSAVFIASPPQTHYELVKIAVNNGIHVFSELNIRAYDYKSIIQIARNKGIVLFLSSTMLYRREVEYIQKIVAKNHNMVGYRYHVGQYLPDWHPWERYQDFFIGDRRTDACREIMALEIPWITAVFGGIKDVYVKKSTISKLEVDYPDSYSILFDHKTGIVGTINIDVVSRKSVRSFELIGENIYLNWNGTPDSLTEYDFTMKKDRTIELYSNPCRNEIYNATILENAYYDEIVDFFRVITNRTTPRYSLEKDDEVLRVVDYIQGERDAIP